MELRDQGTLQLDALKKQVGLNKAIEAEAVYEVADESLRKKLEAYGADLEDLVGAGFHSLVAGTAGAAPSVKLVDRRDVYKACARSWKRRPDVGQDAQYPDLSLRHAAAVRAIGKIVRNRGSRDKICRARQDREPVSGKPLRKRDLQRGTRRFVLALWVPSLYSGRKACE